MIQQNAHKGYRSVDLVISVSKQCRAEEYDQSGTIIMANYGNEAKIFDEIKMNVDCSENQAMNNTCQ